MATIAEIRAQYPQYADMPDTALADALHKKFYADIPRADFDVKIGLTPAAPPQVPILSRTRRPLKIDSFTANPSSSHQAPPLKPLLPANPVSEEEQEQRTVVLR